MSLRPRAAEANALVSQTIPLLSSRATATATAPATFWQRRDVRHDAPKHDAPTRHLPINRNLEKDKSFVFLHEGQDRSFFSQSTNNGDAIGEMASVDVMAAVWTRRTEDEVFDVVLLGHESVHVLSGVVTKRGLDWGLQPTKGNHLALLSQNLHSALSAGIDFGIEKEKAPPPAPTPTLAPPMPTGTTGAEAEVATSLSKIEVSPPEAQSVLGRCEVGSYFSTQQTLAAEGGEVEQRGDKWSIVRPWDDNVSIKGVAEFSRFEATSADAGASMKVAPQKDRSAIGILFPTRGRPTAGMGALVSSFELTRMPIGTVLGAEPEPWMAAYLVKAYDETGTIIGVVDVVPDTRRVNETTVTASRFIATPAIGKQWIGTPGVSEDVITIDKEDVDRCRNGDICPWSLDFICILESAIMKLQIGPN